jgi:hypothetical protein
MTPALRTGSSGTTFRSPEAAGNRSELRYNFIDALFPLVRDGLLRGQDVVVNDNCRAHRCLQHRLQHIGNTPESRAPECQRPQGP